MTERLHPQSYNTLEQLVKLHGAARVIEAVKEINRRLCGPINPTPYQQFVDRNGGRPAFKQR
jgi:hypothetical protein